MDDPAEAGIFARESDYLGRYVQVGTAGEKLISLSTPEEPDEGAEVGGDHPLLDRIDDYLAGAEDNFDDVPVGLTVPTDQRRVLEAVRAIPFGRDASVEQVVRSTPGLDDDEADDLRTVREALAANPVPLVIPDHRVRDGPSALPPEVEQKLRAVEGL